VEATDSLIVRDCIFQSATTAFVVDEPGPGSQARIRFERCAFTGLLQAARIAAPAVADVRVAFYDCAFTDCSVGIEISATGVNCSPGGPPAPPVVESDVRATLVRCTFGHTAGTCLNVSNLPGGLLLDKCTFNVNTISINAALTGVLMRDTIIQGDGGAGRGVVVTSSRLEIVRSTVTGHDVGITVRDFPDCRLSSGNLGGNQDDFNRLGGNTTWNLDTSNKLTADYTYWNALNCADAQAKVTGQGLGITDAVGRLCPTATRPDADDPEPDRYLRPSSSWRCPTGLRRRAAINHLAPLWPYLFRRKTTLLWGVVSLVFTNVLALIGPWVLKLGLDELGHGITHARLLTYAGLIILSTAAAGIGRYYMRQTMIGASRWIEFDLRNDFFAHLSRMSAAFYQRHPTGDLMALATNDLNAVRNVLGPGIMRPTRSPCWPRSRYAAEPEATLVASSRCRCSRPWRWRSSIPASNRYRRSSPASRPARRSTWPASAW
jgi:hypothetical protein